MKLVSIIIPVYNREDMVNDAIKSSLNQDYKNIEIILVDDGSTDNTLNVLQKFEQEYSNIKLITQKNQGATKARLAGLKIASGDFVVFLDSDDLINEKYVSGLINAQQKNDANITIARMHQYTYLNNHLVHLIYKKFPRNFTIERRKDILPTIWVGNAAKLYKRSAINIEDYGLVANEDLANNYFNYVKNQIMAANNGSIYTIRPATNSLAENYLRQNVSLIDNTLKPLEIEKKLFSENGYYEKYFSELEAIFIHNIIERIDNINNSDIAIDKKNKLISCLINYLNFSFPSWKNNKYYRLNFINGSIYEIFYAISTRKSIRKNYNSEQLNYQDTLDTYSKILK